MCLNGFTFFTDSLIRCPEGVLLGLICLCFGDHGDNVSDFWGYWGQAWILIVFQGYPGRDKVGTIHPKCGNPFVPGSSKQLPNTRLLTCKLLNADTRLANWQLQTAGLEKTWKADFQLGLGTAICKKSYAAWWPLTSRGRRMCIYILLLYIYIYIYII